jgi:hypothetical protein
MNTINQVQQLACISERLLSGKKSHLPYVSSARWSPSQILRQVTGASRPQAASGDRQLSGGPLLYGCPPAATRAFSMTYDGCGSRTYSSTLQGARLGSAASRLSRELRDATKQITLAISINKWVTEASVRMTGYNCRNRVGGGPTESSEAFHDEGFLLPHFAEA